jgi:hypothetical protein
MYEGHQEKGGKRISYYSKNSVIKMGSSLKRYLRLTSISLLLLTAINATVAGMLFIIDPSGDKMGMSVSYIKDSPFNSYLIPGIILLIVNGLLNFIAAYFVFEKKPFASFWVIIQGILLSGWIVIQVIMVKDISMLHITMFTIGMILTVSGFLLLALIRKEANR